MKLIANEQVAHLMVAGGSSDYHPIGIHNVNGLSNSLLPSKVLSPWKFLSKSRSKSKVDKHRW